ncbi:uncharacterized protein [Procambarus clarkii]|uniref:uncharacterized protein n=1 Tax=Procambarus clarkii TaxID=6728 RepID=UPI003743BC5A
MLSGSSEWCVLGGEGSGVDSSAVTFVTVATPDMLQEVARGRDTYACQEWPDYIPAHGVDGDNTTMSHSAENLQYPWWLVDLGQIRLVHQVKILPRQAVYPERFNNVEIRVGVELDTSGNFSSYRLFSFYDRVYTADQGVLSCYRRDAVDARYISIKRVTSGEILQILEVEVFAFV